MWTETRVEELKSMWLAGRSASECAAALGITRNAAIGKVHRLNLPARKTLVMQERQQDRRHAPGGNRYRQRSVPRLKIKRSGNGHHTYVGTVKSQEAPVIPKPVALPEPASLDVTLMDLKPGQCRWAHGDGPFLFCGAPAIDGKSYCPHHHARAYQPAKSQRRTNSNVRYLMRHA